MAIPAAIIRPAIKAIMPVFDPVKANSSTGGVGVSEGVLSGVPSVGVGGTTTAVSVGVEDGVDVGVVVGVGVGVLDGSSSSGGTTTLHLLL
jgi:hypothetical protein